MLFSGEKADPGDPEHLKIPVTVPGIKGFDQNTHLKLATTAIAYTFFLGG
jgi:hypothetical protein